jgi:ferric-dicitrate binding protein FerR (iron transport regulator)
MEKQDMNDEREAFEAWYEPDPHNREALTTYRHKDGNYYNAPYLAGCWQGWQARAALPAAQPMERLGKPYLDRLIFDRLLKPLPCQPASDVEQMHKEAAEAIHRMAKLLASLAAPVAAQPTSGVQPSPAPSWEEVRYFFAIMMFGATGKARASWERAIDEAADGGPGPLRDLKAHLTAGVQEVRNAD